MSKDFAKSYEQRAWNFTLGEHTRMQRWIEEFGERDTPAAKSLVERAKSRISELETKYPQLKKKM